MADDTPKQTLNIRSPALKGRDNSASLINAVNAKLLHKETFDEAWARILAMKNSEADTRRLYEVKKAMEDGQIARESENTTKRFSKAEALRMWRKLDEIKAQERLRKMVEETPDNYVMITDKQELSEMLSELMSEELIVFDVESTGVDVWKDYIVGHVLSATSTDMHYYIPIAHDDEREQLEPDYVNAELKPLYENDNIAKIAHNLKYDYQMLRQLGITVKGRLFDTQEAMKMLNENEQSYALKPLVSKYLRIESYGYADLFGKGTGFNEVDLDTALAYAAKDGDITYKLYKFQRHHLAKHGNILEYFETVEMPLMPIVAEMELNGYVIDREFAKEYGDQLRKEAEESYTIVQEKLLPAYKKYVRKNNENPPLRDFTSRDNPGKPIILPIPDEVNLNSPKQLKSAIEEYVGEEIDNTDANKTLKPLSKKYSVILELLNYREKSKLLSTYIDALPELIREESGRLHTVYNQNGAKTGRFSSGGGGVNLQNQPEEARSMFIAPEGYLLLGGDWSQQEYRCLAYYTQEPSLIENYVNGNDLYTEVASDVFKKPVEECGDGTVYRAHAKVLLLAVAYGGGANMLKESIGVTKKEAQRFLSEFFDKYPKVSEWIKSNQTYVKRHGYVWLDHMQRKRRLPGARDHNSKTYYSSVFTQSTNARVQGSSAIQTKSTMIAIDELCRRKTAEGKGEWTLWAVVHDEAILCVPDTIDKEDIADFEDVMVNTYKFGNVPNKCDIEIQRRWGDSITAEDFINGKEVPEL